MQGDKLTLLSGGSSARGAGCHAHPADGCCIAWADRDAREGGLQLAEGIAGSNGFFLRVFMP